MTFIVAASTHAHAQVAPTATGGNASMQYSLRYSQIAEIYGGSQGDQQKATASGDFKYIRHNEHLPFSLLYGGGYSWNLSGGSYGNGFFENLLLTQGIIGRNWSVAFEDNVSYRKEAPTTGFSGVAGTGEPIGQPSPTPPTSQSVLSLNTSTVNNTATGVFTLKINQATSVSAGGGSELLAFPDGGGQNTDSLSANASLKQRLNSRNSLSVLYLLTYYSYPGSDTTFNSNILLASYERAWSRHLSSTVGAGPEWINSSNPSIVPSSTRITANATASYSFRSGSASLTYRHATSGGGGYYFGAEADTVSAAYSREIGRKLTFELTSGYRRTTGLMNNGTTNADFGAAQATRKLGRSFSLFGSYTATVQSTSSTLPSSALSGLLQVIDVGISYTPRERQFRH
jgi:hypothetical protein